MQLWLAQYGTRYMYTSTYLLCSPDYRAPLRVGKGQTEMMIPPPFDEALMMIDDHRENLNLCSGILFYFIFGFLLRLLKYLFDFVIRKLKTTQLRKEKSAHFSPGGGNEKIKQSSSLYRAAKDWRENGQLLKCVQMRNNNNTQRCCCPLLIFFFSNQLPTHAL